MELFGFIPYKKVTIFSRLSPEEAVATLENNSCGSAAYFKGSIDHYTFHIQRRMNWYERNSFVTVIKGEIIRHPQGTEIRIRLRLHLLVMAILLILMGAFLRVAVGALMHGQYLALLFLFPATVMGLVFWQIYDGECMQATGELNRMFGGRI